MRRKRNRGSCIGWTFTLRVAYHLLFAISNQYPLSLLIAVNATTTSRTGITEKVFKYNICNGLSNQLLYHASSIAVAIEKKFDGVMVPNHYIINGVQLTNANVRPTLDNSIPFRIVFDQQNFITSIQNISQEYLNSNYEHNQTNKTIRPIQILMMTFNNDKESHSISCAGMETVNDANPQILLKILQQSFQPSRPFQSIIDKIRKKIIIDNSNKDTRTTVSTGICIHHRDGNDWHEHCSRWGSIKDGIYRGNCLGVPNETFFESIQYRGIAPAYHTSSTTGNWIYYCGDHEPPIELTNITFPHRIIPDDNPGQYFFINTSIGKTSIYKRQHDAFDDLLAKVTPRNQNQAKKQQGEDNDKQLLQRVLYAALKNQQHHRDIFALIDFFVCSKIPYFIGNSVSTFSAIQIAIRDNDKSYWYNSQSIPLADIWRSYAIPIVYTYTETSQRSGRLLLQASISSVRKHMPTNPIHIIYHGDADLEFITWLQSMTVQIHHHTNIAWKDSIEVMRQNGKAYTSNLFLHPGNYFGTWQRIDIPLYIESEYCLLLDADTIIRKPFSMSDFGLDLTRSIALSTEFNRHDRSILNAGVMLMNIPYLRKTYNEFVSYILEHVGNATFEHPSPSDQGAYLSFYKDSVSFLQTRFNFKPYWTSSDIEYFNGLILHFHGAKPSDYIRYGIMMMEIDQTDSDNNTQLRHHRAAKKPKCDSAIQSLCEEVPHFYFLCPSLQEFSQYVNYDDYCKSSMDNNTNHVTMCITLLQTMFNDSNTIVGRRSPVTNNLGCRYFDKIIFGPYESKNRRKVLDKEMQQKRPPRLIKKKDMQELQIKYTKYVAPPKNIFVPSIDSISLQQKSTLQVSNVYISLRLISIVCTIFIACIWIVQHLFFRNVKLKCYSIRFFVKRKKSL
jgi:hypothetical protein